MILQILITWEFLKENGLKVSAIVTEIPTNPFVQTVDLEKLKNLCKFYIIFLWL